MKINIKIKADGINKFLTGFKNYVFGAVYFVGLVGVLTLPFEVFLSKITPYFIIPEMFMVCLLPDIDNRIQKTYEKYSKGMKKCSKK